MAEKISIGIELTGGTEVERQLDDIGKTGQQAFQNIASGSESLQETTVASQQAADGLEHAAEATKKLAEESRGLSLEQVKTGAEIARTTAEIAKIGVEIGLAVQRHRSWIEQLVHLASGANTAARALALLAPELAAVGVGLGVAAGAVGAVVVGFEALEKAATAAASSHEKLNHSLQMLAESSGQSVKSLQEGKAALEQLGIGGDRFKDVISKMNEAISSLDIGAKFKESADNIEKAGALSNEHFKALANNMGALLPLVKQITEGAKGLTFDPLTTAQSKIDAVTASMKQAADAGKNAGQVLLQFIVNADKLSAIQVGKAFGFTDEDVDRIRRLAAAGVTVEEIFKRIQGTGVLISPESAAAFDKMRTSIAQVDSAWARLTQALESTIFSTLAAQASSALNSIKASALNATAAMVEAFNSAVATISAALKSIGQSDVGKQISGTLQNAFTGLDAIIANIVGGIAKGMGASKEQVEALKNSILGIGQAAQQAGQQGEQGLQLITNPLTGMPELVNRTNQALAQTGQAAQQAGQQGGQGFQIWNEELGKAVPASEAAATAATTAGQSITTAMQGAGAAVSDFVSQLAGITWDVISGAGVAAWNAVTGAIQNAIDALLQFIGLKPQAPATGGGAPGAARGGLIGGRGSGTSDSNLAWLSRGEHVMPAHVVRQPGVLGFLEALRRGGGIPGFAAGGAVGGFFGQVFNSTINLLRSAVQAIRQLQQGFNNSMAGIVASIDRLAEPFNQTIDGIVGTIVQAADTLQQLNLPSKARGGLIGGHGTGTSDSNLAWLSRGEYVTPTRAVQQPGVLAFLEALRRSGGNLRAVLDGMGQFALGGLVPRPAFAAGGAVGSMNHVTIQFPGLQPIGGLRASSSVVDELQRAAALAQVRSGGRKPSRYS